MKSSEGRILIFPNKLWKAFTRKPCLISTWYISQRKITTLQKYKKITTSVILHPYNAVLIGRNNECLEVCGLRSLCQESCLSLSQSYISSRPIYPHVVTNGKRILFVRELVILQLNLFHSSCLKDTNCQSKGNQILTPLIFQVLDFVIYIKFFKFSFPVCVVDRLLKSILNSSSPLSHQNSLCGTHEQA